MVLGLLFGFSVYDDWWFPLLGFGWWCFGVGVVWFAFLRWFCRHLVSGFLCMLLLWGVGSGYLVYAYRGVVGCSVAVFLGLDLM